VGVIGRERERPSAGHANVTILSAASAYFRPVWAWVQLWPLSGCWTSAATSRVGGMSHGLVDPTTITAEMAVQIRIWRVDEERSWRAVAEAASDLWGSDYGSNQLYGEDLCTAAAQLLGEDAH